MRRRDLTPRKRKARLQTFGPTGAAFVLHLVACDRCRRHAGKLLGPGGEAAGGGVMHHLTRGGYLLSLAGATQEEDDLPLVELQRFLQALSPEQAAFIHHLLDCERCRRAVAKTLKPPAVSAARKLPVVLG